MVIESHLRLHSGIKACIYKLSIKRRECRSSRKAEPSVAATFLHQPSRSVNATLNITVRVSLYANPTDAAYALYLAHLFRQLLESISINWIGFYKYNSYPIRSSASRRSSTGAASYFTVVWIDLCRSCAFAAARSSSRVM